MTSPASPELRFTADEPHAKVVAGVPDGDKGGSLGGDEAHAANPAPPGTAAPTRAVLTESLVPALLGGAAGAALAWASPPLLARQLPGGLVPWLAREFREIVGVVANVKQENLSDPPPAQIYVPQQQSPWFSRRSSSARKAAPRPPARSRRRFVAPIRPLR